MADSEDSPPRRLVAGRYRLVRELGRGGMGTVWLAEDQLVGRQVAVKELRLPHGLSGPDQELYGRRALQEARSAALIRHPHAVTLYDVLPATAADDAVYLIMELLDGPTLARLIGRDGPLPAPAVAACGLQLLSVLETAHALGVVHRDIKPANIIMVGGTQAKLTDFGIAHTVGETRLTRSGVMGTQAYMAPELFDSAAITPAADLWSLGATLYHAADGNGPFERDTTGATLRAILMEDLPAPCCPPPLAAAITGLLQRDPARRASIGQAHAALQAAAQGATTTAAPEEAPASGANRGPSASLLQPRWARLSTTRSPAPPPAPPPPSPEPPPPTPGRPSPPRRTAVIAVIAAAVVLAAIAGGVLASGHLGGTSHPKPPTIHPSLVATLSNPGRAGVGTVAFSPDGKTLATGGDNSVYLWDTASHSITATLIDPGSKGVNSVAFSPDGQALAVADSNGSTYLWSTVSHRITATLADPSGRAVTSVAFSPDGQTLATGAYNNRVYLWNTTSHSITATLTVPGDLGGISAVAFSPGGQALAVADINGSTYLWSTATHRITATLADSGVDSAAFSPDGKMLATADDNGSVYLWDIATRSVLATLTGPKSRHGVNSVAFSPDGSTLATASYDAAIGYVWNIASRSIIGTVSDPGGHEEMDAVFSPDGTMLATGDDDGSAYLWRVAQGG